MELVKTKKFPCFFLKLRPILEVSFLELSCSWQLSQSVAFEDKMPFLWRLCGCVVSHLDAYLTNPTISRNAMWKRSMATDNQLVRGLGGSGQHCWANQKRLDQGATTGLLCVLQNGSPIFHSFLDTMLTQNTWCWWAGGVPWCHHFVGSNPHGCYHFVGVPIPFCREVGWAPYTLVGPTSRGEFPWGWKLDVFFMTFKGPPEPSRTNNLSTKWKGAITSTSMFMILWHYHFVAGSCWFKTYFVRISSAKLHGFVGGDCGGCLCNRLGNGDPT